MERLDDILGYSNLKIYQNSDFFSFSLDSIMLANFATIRLRDKKIVDFCTGNGVVPMILTRRCHTPIDGVEIQEKLADLATRSIKENHLEDQITIYCEDVKEFSKKHLNEYDLVLCNPPYFKVNEVNSFNESYEKRIARHEIAITLSDICDGAKKVLKDNGNLCMIHRSDRFIEILEEFKKHGIEPKRVKFFHETKEKESTLVLIEGQKCGKVGLKVDSPFIEYDENGEMTEEYQKLQVEVRK